jgi:hypothetical protein
MQDWEREQQNEMFRQQASQYMHEQTMRNKEEAARRLVNGSCSGQCQCDGEYEYDPFSAALGWAVVLFIAGVAFYAWFIM